MIPLAVVVLLAIVGLTVLAAVVGGTIASRRSTWVSAEDETCEFPAVPRNTPSCPRVRERGSCAGCPFTYRCSDVR